MARFGPSDCNRIELQMFRGITIAILYISVLSVTAVRAESTRKLEEALSQAVCCAHYRYNEAIRLFEEIKQKGNPSFRALYYAAFAYMKLHLPEEAGPLLEQLERAQYQAPHRWKSVQELLKRVHDVNRLSPLPHLNKSGRNAPASITIYAGPPTTWSRPVLEALPQFEKIGRRIFGEKLQPVNFYIFSDRPTFEEFFSAMFGGRPPFPWQNGTGSTNIVMYCEIGSSGKITRPAGTPETMGSVIHEFGHAWMNSYIMKYHNANILSDDLRNPWLDEGISTYIAYLWDSNIMKRRVAGVISKKDRARIPPPAFDDLINHREFYQAGDRKLNYWLSSLLVRRILGPQENGGVQIPKILDALVQTQDSEAAIKIATGKDARKEYERLVQHLWSD